MPCLFNHTYNTSNHQPACSCCTLDGSLFPAALLAVVVVVVDVSDDEALYRGRILLHIHSNGGKTCQFDTAIHRTLILVLYWLAAQCSAPVLCHTDSGLGGQAPQGMHAGTRMLCSCIRVGRGRHGKDPFSHAKSGCEPCKGCWATGEHDVCSRGGDCVAYRYSNQQCFMHHDHLSNC